MTRDNDFKKLVRARMRKTGESYTASRSQLLRKKTGTPSTVATTTPARTTRSAKAVATANAPGPEIAAGDMGAMAGMTDAAVRAKTGRTWSEWVAILDTIGADQRPHRDIAQYLYRDLGVAGWWSQMVTVGYERIRGLRDKGQRRGGGYEVNKSKTIAVAISTVYRAFTDKRTRTKWLPVIEISVRTATAGKSMRITWPDGSDVQVYFGAKGPQRSVVTIQHGKLASRAEADRMRGFWTERLETLAAQLTARM